jgi:transcriptional regulator with XRE-family HTH domain
MTEASRLNPSELAARIGDRLRATREAAKLSREQVGAAAGVGGAAVGAWERGITTLGPHAAHRIAPLLGVSAAFLLLADEHGEVSRGPYLVNPAGSIAAAANAAQALGCELRIVKRGKARAFLIERCTAA